MTFTESNNIELKESYSVSIFKTISAFANFRDGIIYIGINDLGYVTGVSDIKSLKIDIKNRINDSITPRPTYQLNTFILEEKNVLEIIVNKGVNGPYFYKNTAYTRNDTSTIALDTHGLTELILNQKNLSYDQMISEQQNLTFEHLSKEFKKSLDIEDLNSSVFKTLGFYSQNHFNHGAALLSDNGQINNSYIDIAKFRLDTTYFQDRITYSNNSILFYFENAIHFIRNYYPEIELIEGTKRIKQEIIPLVALREAIANAIIHRDYMIPSGIQIALFDNRIEIISPGGLPEGMTEELYYQGLTSISRNQVISYVFYRLGYIERFGTGIKRIIDSYKPFHIKPSFIIKDTQIKIILPVTFYDYKTLKEKDAIIAYLSAFPKASRAMIESNLGLEKATAIRKINTLIENDEIMKIGEGPAVVYQRK